MEAWYHWLVDFRFLPHLFHAKNATIQLRSSTQDWRFWRLQYQNVIEDVIDDVIDHIFILLSMVWLASHGRIWATNVTTNWIFLLNSLKLVPDYICDHHPKPEHERYILTSGDISTSNWFWQPSYWLIDTAIALCYYII